MFDVSRHCWFSDVFRGCFGPGYGQAEVSYGAKFG